MTTQPENEKAKSARPGYFNALPDETRAWMSSYLGDTMVSIMEFVLTVGLELVRHLAIINGAVLAGVTALYSSIPDSARPIAVSAAESFLFGLGFAVLTLLATYVIGVFLVSKINSVITPWVANRAPWDPKILSKFYLFGAPPWICGLISMSFFLIGAVKFLHAFRNLL